MGGRHVAAPATFSCIGFRIPAGDGGRCRAQTLRTIDSNLQTLAANDDGSTGNVSLGFNVNFFGREFSSLFVNNNGNVTFDSALATFTPFNLNTTNRVIIAPFFADVDTRGTGSGITTYGNTTVNGRPAFVAHWPNVGYFSAQTDKLNNFQLVIVDRSDIAPGAFDVEFNYAQIQWETGSASGGTNGLGGSSARVGLSNGTTESVELPGSGVPGTFLDSNTTTGLIFQGQQTPGRVTFQVRDGEVFFGSMNVTESFAETTSDQFSRVGEDVSRGILATQLTGLVRSISNRLQSMRRNATAGTATASAGGGQVIGLDGNGMAAGIAGGDLGSMLGPISVWFDGNRTRLDSDRAGQDYDARNDALLFGIDAVLLSRAVIGAVASVEFGNTNISSDPGEQDNRTYSGTLYGAYSIDDTWSVDALAGYGYNKTDLKLARLGAEVSGDYGADRYFAAANVSGLWGYESFELLATAGYRYAIEYPDDYTASNGQPVDPGSSFVGTARVGGEIAYLMEGTSPFVGGYYEHDTISSDSGDDTGFVGEAGLRVNFNDQLVGGIFLSQGFGRRVRECAVLPAAAQRGGGETWRLRTDSLGASRHWRSPSSDRRRRVPRWPTCSPPARP